MSTHPAHAQVSRPESPLGTAQRHTKEVGRRNVRVIVLAYVGIAIVVTLACLALWFAAAPRP